MKSLSSVGLGLSIVFGCLLLALVAEVYYLLWWKKRISSREIENDYSSPVKELFYMFCWKRPSSLRQGALNHRERCSTMRISEAHVHDPESQQQVQAQNGKDFLFKPFGEDYIEAGEDYIEAEYRGQNELVGPPRFLFTIVEETKEDLESEDGKSKAEKSGKNSRSLSDFLCTVETPYLTPLTSPPFFTPPLTPRSLHFNNQHGFNPLFESATDAEFNRIRSSPPPKFKFLEDAEEKLKRKLREKSEEEGKRDNETDDSFVTVLVDKRKGSHSHLLPQYHSSTSQSQVLPLVS